MNRRFKRSRELHFAAQLFFNAESIGENTLNATGGPQDRRKIASSARASRMPMSKRKPL
jgi:hypothetical protein